MFSRTGPIATCIYADFFVCLCALQHSNSKCAVIKSPPPPWWCLSIHSTGMDLNKKWAWTEYGGVFALTMHILVWPWCQLDKQSRGLKPVHVWAEQSYPLPTSARLGFCCSGVLGSLTTSWRAVAQLAPLAEIYVPLVGRKKLQQWTHILNHPIFWVRAYTRSTQSSQPVLIHPVHT